MRHRVDITSILVIKYVYRNQFNQIIQYYLFAGGFSGFEGLAAGIPTPDQPQSSRSKLSRLLGSDFGPLGKA
jgi:hypothetical protein